MPKVEPQWDAREPLDAWRERVAREMREVANFEVIRALLEAHRHGQEYREAHAREWDSTRIALNRNDGMYQPLSRPSGHKTAIPKR